jgi:hypothetical protein
MDENTKFTSHDLIYIRAWNSWKSPSLDAPVAQKVGVSEGIMWPSTHQIHIPLETWYDSVGNESQLS